MITRIWKGKKEAVDVFYYCGQIWDIDRQLWKTVTDRLKSEDLAADALERVKKELKKS